MRRSPFIRRAIALVAAASAARTLAQREGTGTIEPPQEVGTRILQHPQQGVNVDRPSPLDANLHNPLHFTSPGMADPKNGTSFCDNSMTMSMFMDGFHSSLLSVTSSFSSSSPRQPLNSSDDAGSNSSEPPSPPRPLPSCLSYLSPTFELSSPGRFALAMLASFLFAFSLEALTALKSTSVLSKRSPSRSPTGTSGDDALRFGPGPRQRRFLPALMHGLRGLLGFILMLVIMAYSVELVASVVAGVMAGNAAFGNVAPPAPAPRSCSCRCCCPAAPAEPPSRQPPQPNRETTGTEPESSLSPLLQPLLQAQNDQSFVV
jgi:Ctr copper transporter family